MQVGYGDEDEEHICMAYEKNQWVNLRRESLAGEVRKKQLKFGFLEYNCEFR